MILKVYRYFFAILPSLFELWNDEMPYSYCMRIYVYSTKERRVSRVAGLSTTSCAMHASTLPAPLSINSDDGFSAHQEIGNDLPTARASHANRICNSRERVIQGRIAAFQ